MHIRWANLIILALLVLALVVAIRGREEILGLLSTIESIGPGGDPRERTLGIIALGIIALAAVGIARILQQRRNP